MIIVNFLGFLLIFFIIWWFWLYKEKQTKAIDNTVFIVVEDGVYQPAHIRLPEGQPITLRFFRKDPSPCAATVVFPDFDIAEDLPLEKVKDVLIPAQKPGHYPFTCQMQMYRGELIVASQ